MELSLRSSEANQITCSSFQVCPYMASRSFLRSLMLKTPRSTFDHLRTNPEEFATSQEC